jgi:hypothetical protein
LELPEPVELPSSSGLQGRGQIGELSVALRLQEGIDPFRLNT